MTVHSQAKPITPLQDHVLSNLHRIVTWVSGSHVKAFLDGKSCSLQLDSLGAMGLVRQDASGRPVRVADPIGVRDPAAAQARRVRAVEPRRTG